MRISVEENIITLLIKSYAKYFFHVIMKRLALNAKAKGQSSSLI